MAPSPSPVLPPAVDEPQGALKKLTRDMFPFSFAQKPFFVVVLLTYVFRWNHANVFLKTTAIGV